MAATNDQVLHVLRGLYRIVEAGERGFATAAINAKRKGLKLLFKSFAQQRADFKEEILAEIRRLGGDDAPGSSVTGMIHRGRVAIYSAMIIEDERRERVILKEAALGERYAEQTYKKALAADLPKETRAIVEQQYSEVRRVIEAVQLLRGRDGKRMLVRLFDTEQEASSAIQLLKRAGFTAESVRKLDVSETIALYEGKGITVPETILSGAVGGVVWGSLIGVLAGFGVLQTNAEFIRGSPLLTWALIAVGITLIGAMVGGILGLVLGAGIADDDRYAYSQSSQDGNHLVTAVVKEAQINEAGMILQQVDKQSSGAVFSESV